MQLFNSRQFRISHLLWLAWLAFAVSLTWPAMKWELDYFRHPGPRYFTAVLVLLAVSPLLFFLWKWIRSRFLRRHELAILTICVAVVCAVYQPAATAVVILVSAGYFAVGRRLSRALGVRASGPVEDIAVSTATGLGVLHCALFVIGLAGGYVWSAFLLLLILPFVFCISELIALRDSLGQIQSAWPLVADSWRGALLSLSALFLLVPTLMVALAPSVYYDMLRFHLPLVRYYASHHTLHPPFAYGYYPQSVETVMTLGYSLAGQPAAQMLPELYFGLALLALFRICRVSGMERFAAAAGVVSACSIPALHWTGSSGKNDFALAAFAFCALLAFLRWRETQEYGWILLGTFFIAMAAGVKHIVLFALPPLVVLYAWAAWRQPRRMFAFVKIAAILLTFGFIWHMRAWLATGNPLYPSAPGTAIETLMPNSHTSFLRDVAWSYVRFPWELHFRGRVYYESVSDYPMGIVLVLFAPVWFLVRPRFNVAAVVPLGFCAAYLVCWSVSVGMIRYAIAAIAILSAFTIWKLMNFVRMAPRIVKLLVFLACCYALLFNWCGIAIDEINVPQIRYFLWRIDAHEYLREALLPYRALEFVNHSMKPGDGVLGVDACSEVYVASNAVFDCYPLTRLTRWEEARAMATRGPYRFLIVPHSQALDLPAGFRQAYADEHFSVFTRY